MNRLRFSLLATERDLRLAIVECGKVAYERHLVTSNDGNISVRVGKNVLITPSGICKGRMDPEDLLVVDLDGNILKAQTRRKPKTSSETPMHLEVYRQREDVRAVLHAHPIFATALTIADVPFPVDILPEVLLTLGEVPVTEYSTPSSDEDAAAVRSLIRDHDALLLCQHGSLTVGPDLETALNHVERIEHVAQTVFYARQLGSIHTLPPEALEKLKEVRKKMFLEK
jgi:L-fuculose-phosphate aldolase